MSLKSRLCFLLLAAAAIFSFGAASGQVATPPVATPPAAKPPAAKPPAAAKVSDVIAGIPVNYDESKVGTYTLPDPLVMLDGKKVKDAKTWTNKRRPEVLKLAEENEYGRTPGRPKDMSFDVFDKGTPAFNGTAIRRQITIYFSKDKNGPKEDLVLYLPANARKPVPVLLNISFSPNASSIQDPDIRLGEMWGRGGARVPQTRGRGIGGGLKVEATLARGYGVASVYYGDIDPDFLGGVKLGVRAMF